MGDERTRRIFLSLVLTAAALLAALEVTLARAGGPTATVTAPWVTPLQDMDSALERGDLASAATAQAGSSAPRTSKASNGIFFTLFSPYVFRC